jgi:acetoin utilization protein AcuB
MSVKDFMTRKVVYISPDTTIAHAADLMREQDLHRLPVIENDKLVGLVTEGTIAEASPSKATSLSIYEMNYLLNKTKVKDVMIKDVITVSAYASLEDATYLMYKNKVGILPVVDNDQLYGVITDRDIFAAFLQVSGYGEEEFVLVSSLTIKLGNWEKLFVWFRTKNIISSQLYKLLLNQEK